MAEIESKIMGFGRSFPEPFNSLTSKRSNVLSKYNPSAKSGVMKSTIGGLFLQVLMYIAKEHLTMDRKLAIGSIDGETCIAEYHSQTGEVHIITYDGKKLRGAVYDPKTETSEAYVFDKGKQNGGAVIAAMFLFFMKDDEFEDTFDEFLEQAEMDFPNLVEAGGLVAKMCDNVYYRLKDASCPVHITVEEPFDNLPLIRAASIKDGSLDPDNVYVGCFEVLNTATSANSSKKGEDPNKKTVSELIGKYAIDPNREFTEEEKLNMAVNRIADEYIPNGDDIEMCELIKATSQTLSPFRTFTLRGEAGSGKSTTTRAIASFLKQPFVQHTCSVNTEIFDFIGQVMPSSTSSAKPSNEIVEKIQKMGGELTFDNIARVLELPTMDDILFDPTMAYEEITGIPVTEKGGMFYAGDTKISDTEGGLTREAICKWNEIIKSQFDEVLLAVNEEVGNTNFIYTETDFIRAVKYGWVCEIQEPNVIMSEGVLVGLNGLLQEGTITLPTGEVIQKHPDCVIIFTTNVSYNGCRAMNQSVIDRSNAVYDIEKPSTETMAARAMAMSGLTDFDTVFEMAEIVTDISDMMVTNSIDDGVCGMRSLTNWATAARYMNPYQAFNSCVLSKTSMDEESRLALKKRIDESSFRPSKRSKRI